MYTYLEKIKQHPLLQKSFSYVIENNKSSFLPYHNTRHILNVFNIALEIAESMKLEKSDIIELGIACLFHDINHSGGKLKDFENIRLAVDELMKFFKLNEKEFKHINLLNIIDMILCTEYPQNKIPKKTTELIIVDADFLQAFDTDWFLFTIKGLSLEFGIDVSRALENQYNFIKNINYYTEYGQNLYRKHKKRYLKEIEQLKTYFK